jgi:two-component system, sensor histidine kinase and response regulator
MSIPTCGWPSYDGFREWDVAETKPSVLLVDDVEANLIATQAVLEGLGCEIVRAGSGNEALRLLLKRDFAAMLLDVQMPVMDGYEVAQYVRENPVTRDVPILFLTAAQITDETVLRAYGTGAVDFLVKPVNTYILRAKVRVFLDLYLGRQRLSKEVAAHKQTLEALEQANEALRHFTHAASHDLKAPLRAARGFLEIFSEHVGDRLDPEARSYMARIAKANERMDSLLDSLLAYAQLQRSRPFAQVNCEELMEHVRTDLAERLEASRATLRVGKLPLIQGDADRIYQLFLNLVGNAVKFRRPSVDPCISVSAGLEQNEWVFSVEDNGIGIDPEYRSSVFEPFRRLHSQERYEGTGLGLALCSQIIQQHAGRIWVEASPDGGSRFCFVLNASR